MANIFSCPMCGSPAKIDSTGTLECFGHGWQTIYIECTHVNDPHCGMELSLCVDSEVVQNSFDRLIDCWNSMSS